MKIVPVVSGILQHDNKLLIAERPSGTPYSGYWEFPGGKIEANESAEQALIRELDEELGIQVETCKFLFLHEYAYPDKIVHLQVWDVMQFSGEPEGKINQELKWVSLPEMMSMRLLAGNGLVVERLKEYFPRR